MKSKRPSKSSLKRGKQLREEYELIAIVCEGTKTEPLYYDDVKKVERLPSANIFVTGDCGSDPLSVVKHGIYLYEKSFAEKNPSTLMGPHYWRMRISTQACDSQVLINYF